MHSLAKSCARVAALLAEVGANSGDSSDFDESFLLAARALSLWEGLSRQDPKNVRWRRPLAGNLVMNAQAHVLAQRDLDKARQDCQRALAMETELATADASNLEA